MKTQVYFLPGFLGLPSDFDQLTATLAKAQPTWEVITVDYRIPQIGPKVSLRDWGQEFNVWADSQGPADHRVLVGYSLGGRLGLHAISEGKDAWQSAILLSTHPGLASIDETEMRVKADQHWAARFASEDFYKVMSDWNSQPVFSGSTNEPLRQAEDYQKEYLTNCLINWSLGRQIDFTDRIFKMKIPQLWLAGERDIKFARMVKELEMEKGSLADHLVFEVVQNASHRLLFDQPELIARMIAEFAAT